MAGTDFSFKQFKNSSELINAVSSLEDLIYELTLSNYDYTIKGTHTFEFNGFMIDFNVSKDSISSVQITNIKYDEEGVIS